MTRPPIEEIRGRVEKSKGFEKTELLASFDYIAHLEALLPAVAAAERGHCIQGLRMAGNDHHIYDEGAAFLASLPLDTTAVLAMAEKEMKKDV
ncbi:hypothetical protein IAD21_00925 [Abditibacteriota bacterium]|nr:hypothetical protein IAD21_00925 [Abditibacteriota bacterium]